jgi:hypothetical protein
LIFVIKYVFSKRARAISFSTLDKLRSYRKIFRENEERNEKHTTSRVDSLSLKRNFELYSAAFSAVNCS